MQFIPVVLCLRLLSVNMMMMLMLMLMLMMMMVCWPGTVVYCLDADKKDILVRINLVDSLPTTSLSPAHCASDKRKGFASFLCYNIVSYDNISDNRYSCTAAVIFSHFSFTVVSMYW